MQVAKPTIAEVFSAYLAERKQKLPPPKFRDHEDIVGLFEHCLDGYAYQALSLVEQSFWEDRLEADEEAGSFCRTFGPDKILPEVDHFLGWYVIRKVLGPQSIAHSAGPVIGDFVAWLVENGHVSEKDASDAIERASGAAKDLPRAEKLSTLLYELTEEPDAGKIIEDLDLVDDMVTISKVEPKQIWFEGPGEEEIGPLTVPEKASTVAAVGWRLSAAHFVRTAKGWQLIEMGNVYP